MKKTIYLSLCALFLVTFSCLRAGATGVISAHYDFGFCGTTFDSGNVMETGYTTGDSIIMYYGDGSLDTEAPVYSGGGSATYGPSHFYVSGGVYSRKIVLLSGGVRIDSVSYSYTWAPCKFIEVLLYDDVNSDCVFDAGDAYIWMDPTQVEIDSAGVPVDTVWATYWLGYQAYGPTGTVYTFKVLTAPHGFLSSCPTSGIVTTTLSTASIYIDTLGFACDPSACLDNSIAANFCPGLSIGWSWMSIMSTSCTPVSTTVDLTFSPKYTLAYVYGATSYTVSGNVATLVVPSVSASTPAMVSVGFNPVGTLTLGDTAQTTWTLNPFSGDCDLTNNVVTSVDTIHSSYDPNHKSVQPDGYIAAGTNLKYMISFENTGNATAQNIHIMDTLSDNVDIHTIKQIASSSYAEMTLSTWAGHNIVKFDFPNINLLDSTHHGLNEGFVQYTINAKSTLTPGTTIDNTASIYFDVNAPVVTNPVENKIYPISELVGKVSASQIAVYPNPVNDILTVSADNTAYNRLTVTNTVGQVVISQEIVSKQTNVSVQRLPAGVYYITLKGDGGVKVQQFEKL